VGGDIAGKELHLTPIRKFYVWFNYFYATHAERMWYYWQEITHAI